MEPAAALRGLAKSGSPASSRSRLMARGRRRRAGRSRRGPRPRPLGLDDQRQRADGLDVGADVVAADAVAAGDGPGELAVPVEDGDAQPVDLELGRVGDRPVGQELADAVFELPDLVLGVAVVDAQHRGPVDDGREALDGLLADPLGRRLGRHQARGSGPRGRGDRGRDGRTPRRRSGGRCRRSISARGKRSPGAAPRPGRGPSARRWRRTRLPSLFYR